MDFDFDINNVLKDTISLITGSLKVLNQRNNYAEVQEIIDTAGIKSAKAQRLSAPITSLSKLRINAHRIYILTNRTSTTRATAVIGFIKVGTKQLFVLDHEGTHHQTHPLCVLDFYIHESHQRKGYGLKLFKHMLQSEHVNPSHLAIDRPSQKFTSFLRKHFNLWATIPQVNNFVVFDGYFKNRKDKIVKNRRPIGDYDEFRPLSRAFTEGTLHTNIRTVDSTALNGIRPASNACVEGDYRFSQSRADFQQSHRSNTFSRYANENTYAQSYPERRSHFARQDEEIVTNPYRNTENSKTKMLEEARLHASPDYSGISQNGKSPTLDLEAIRDSPIDTEILYDRDHLASKDRRSKMFQVIENDQNIGKSTDQNSAISDAFNSKRPQKELFEAKMNHNSLRSYRYKNPSDMIDELKKKDQALSNGSSSYLHRYALGGSSWNVFGIPSPSRYANR